MYANPAARRCHARFLLLLMLWLACAPSARAAAATCAVWDFASDQSPWHPRSKSVALQRVQADGPEGRRLWVLNIRGRMESEWNYAGSGFVPVEPGQAYRLSAWLRVDRLGSGTPLPYLKCEFRGAAGEAGGKSSIMRTDAYDGTRMGQWQRIAGEFRAPDAARSCWFALEKGTNGPTEIDAALADVRFEPVARLTALDTYRLDPLPAPLEKVRGVHPRLFLTAARVTELRTAARGTHAELWKKILERADQAAKSGPPKYILRDKTSGDEQLWQRGVGNAMPTLAMAWLVTGQRQYLASAQQWALASCAYETWGLGHYEGKDLAAGHQLLGLALVYDWCCNDLDPSARTQIRQTLVRRTAALYQAAANGQTGWHRSYLQNHLWVSATGMAAAGLALFDEVPEANEWIGLPLDKFRRTMDALGPDGASHEGVGYWEYGVEYMLKFMDLAESLLGVDLYGSPWWRNTATYAQYLVLPRHAWTPRNCIVDIADCPRYHWYGPEYSLRRLAARFHDPYAQWLANECDRAGVCSPGAPWLNLLWYEPRQPAKPPTDRTTLHHFEDLGIVSSRSDWSGDESLLVFKCGPCLGHEALRKFSYDPGSGHVHPDANHFVLFGHGQWLLRDDGYHPKSTGSHNTLLVDGRGQLGEGAEWFQGSLTLGGKASPPRVLLAESTPAVDHVVGNATGAYPQELCIKRFVRHLLLLKPDVLIVADDVAMEKESPLELRFHSEQQVPRREADGAFVTRGKLATMRMVLLTPEGVEASSEVLPLAGRHGSAGEDLFTIRLRTSRAAWRNAVAFSWSAAGEQPAKVSLRAAANVWTFTAGNRSATLDWSVPPNP